LVASIGLASVQYLGCPGVSSGNLMPTPCGDGAVISCPDANVELDGSTGTGNDAAGNDAAGQDR
jgi:hypothetical protein